MNLNQLFNTLITFFLKRYSNIYCGMVRGALEMVQIEVQTWFVQDYLKGDPTTELRVKFVKKLIDALPAGEG